MKYPFVSVIMPVFNEEKRVGKAIEAVLNQNYPDDCFELIVIDDASLDGTENILREFSKRYSNFTIIKNIQNKGDSSSRNLGVKMARGEIIATTDADDVVDKNWLVNISNNYMMNSSDALVGRSKVAFDNNNLSQRLISEHTIIVNNGYFLTEIDPRYKINIRATGTNQSFKKKVFEQIGGYNENLKRGMDVDILWRLVNSGYQVDYDTKMLVHVYTRESLKKTLIQRYNNAEYDAEIRFKNHNIDTFAFLHSIYFPFILISFIFALNFYVIFLFVLLPLFYYTFLSINRRSLINNKKDLLILPFIGYLLFLIASIGYLKKLLTTIFKWRSK